MKKNYEIDSCYITNKGKREANEDSVLALVNAEKHKGVFAVADGLGGHRNGKNASQIVVDTIEKLMSEANIFSNKKIEKWLDVCQAKLLEKKNNPDFLDAKTTIVVLKLDKNIAEYGYVGDTRLYKFSKDKYLFQTKDHSVPQMLVNTGEIELEMIRHHEDRNRLLRVLGAEFKKNPYATGNLGKYEEGDAFLLCSDGFWEWIEERDMLRLKIESNTAQEWLSKMEEVILENAKESTAMDNYTAIAILIK